MGSSASGVTGTQVVIAGFSLSELEAGRRSGKVLTGCQPGETLQLPDGSFQREYYGCTFIDAPKPATGGQVNSEVLGRLVTMIRGADSRNGAYSYVGTSDDIVDTAKTVIRSLPKAERMPTTLALVAQLTGSLTSTATEALVNAAAQ